MKQSVIEQIARIIVTYNQKDLIHQGDRTIRVIPAFDYLAKKV